MKKKVQFILLGLILSLVFLNPNFSYAAASDYIGDSSLELPSFPMESESEPAGSGQWDTLDIIHEYFDSRFRPSKIYYSGGGDFRACTYDVNVAGADGIIEVWSDNPSGDKIIGWGIFREGRCIKVDARPHVDGSNKKAEIYIKVGNVSPPTWARVKIQD